MNISKIKRILEVLLIHMKNKLHSNVKLHIDTWYNKYIYGIVVLGYKPQTKLNFE